MSIVNHLKDPTLEAVPGVETAERGESMDIRALHIGVMNLMPDSAYFQTIQDVAALLNAADRSLQLKIHYINPTGIERVDPRVREHAERYGQSLEAVLDQGVDLVDITGADTEHDYPALNQVPYIKDFETIVDQIENGPITSGIFQCYAFHVLMEVRFGVQRQLGIPEKGDAKNWGIHEHVVPLEARDHYLNRGGDTHSHAVSSRWGDISYDQAREAGLTVLNHAVTPKKSVGAATDTKMNFLGLQTHSEYGTLGLMMEWIRDYNRHKENPIWPQPELPGFLTDAGLEILQRFLREADTTCKEARKRFYAAVEPEVKVNWKAPGMALTHGYVGGVLKLTGKGRHQKYMDGINPDKPLDFLDSNSLT